MTRASSLRCFDLIHTLTGGIPRRINTLCNRLLLATFLAEKHVIDINEVQGIAREIRDELGPDAEHSLVSIVGGTDVGAEPTVRARSDAIWHSHFNHIEERIDRLEKTLSAAVDLLHRLLHPDKAATNPVKPVGALMMTNTVASPRSLGPLVCVVGARPNYMKMAPMVRAFARSADLPRAVLVHTGQHYDVAMNERLFADLELPPPDLNLEVGSGYHAVQTAEVMRRFEPVVDDLAPSCVIVVGDVNSTLACSLVAAKKGFPIFHVEAGLRSFDREMPEEINRILTDQTGRSAIYDRARRRKSPASRGDSARSYPLRRQRDDRFAAPPPATRGRTGTRRSLREGFAADFIDGQRRLWRGHAASAFECRRRSVRCANL